MTEHIQEATETTATATPGQLLKEAREHKGMSLGDIAKKLRLSTQWIKDIEADNYRHINALVYIQGHLRSYAKQVGIAEGVILQALKDLELPLPDSKERPLSSASIPIYDKTSVARRRFLRWMSLGIIILFVVLVSLWWREQAHHQMVATTTNFLSNGATTSQVSSGKANSSLQPVPINVVSGEKSSAKKELHHHGRYNVTYRAVPDANRR